MIKLVTATRGSDEEFYKSTPLGISTKRFKNSDIICCVFSDNREGLSKVYNHAIDSSNPEDILVFVHDDVWIEDLFLGIRLREGLNKFRIIGLAGNARALPEDSPAWHVRSSGELDVGNLSGSVAHGPHCLGDI